MAISLKLRAVSVVPVCITGKSWYTQFAVSSLWIATSFEGGNWIKRRLVITKTKNAKWPLERSMWKWRQNIWSKSPGERDSSLWASAHFFKSCGVGLPRNPAKNEFEQHSIEYVFICREPEMHSAEGGWVQMVTAKWVYRGWVQRVGRNTAEVCSRFFGVLNKKILHFVFQWYAQIRRQRSFVSHFI